MADENDLFIRDLKAEVQREQFEALWKKYAVLVFAAAGLIVASVGGYQYWQWSSTKAAQAAGARYEAALALVGENKLDEARPAFQALSEDGPSGYATLSRLQLAGVHLAQGNKAKAFEIYDAIGKASGIDPLLSGFANLQAASIRADEADFTEMQNRLNALSDESSPWRFTARELLAVSALKAGKREEARKALEQLISDRDAPPAMRERVQILMAKVVTGDIAAEAKQSSKSSTKETGEKAAEAGGATNEKAESATAATTEPAKAQ